MNKQWYYCITLGTLILNGLLLLGIFKAIFGADVTTNLFNTGITPGTILGIANGIVAIWVFKKFV